ncbi:MAG: signal peptidase I [Acidobacteriota bacterium]
MTNGNAQEAPRRHSVFREYLEALIVAAIFLGFSNTFIVKTFYIPSGSMEETLLVGDHLFVNRYIFGPRPTGIERGLLPGREVRRGDIVIFRSPEAPELDLVKRCIGLPGDEIRVVDKELYVNGEQIDDDSYTQTIDTRRDRRLVSFGPETVPTDHLFCMGDNRDESHDSRFFGPVPMAHVKGRAVMVYWSFGGGTPDGQWRGWGAKLRQIGNTALGFVTKTRWSRTFKIIR